MEHRRTAGRIALAYAAFGLAWVVLSDRVVATTVPGSVTVARNIEGAAFVAVSAGLIYALTRAHLRSIDRSQAELGWANRQSAVLQRVFRHNVRNKVGVIRGYAEEIARDAEDPQQAAYAAAIVENADDLVELGDEAKTLRSVAAPAGTEGTTQDAGRAVRAAVERVDERFPGAEIRVDFPAALPVEAHHRLDVAVEQLVENAVEHNDAATPRVRVEGGRTDDGVRIAVLDNGPGIPEVERRVVENGTETPVVHSTGLGLWIAQAVVARSGGELQIDEESEGGRVEVTLPAAGEQTGGRRAGRPVYPPGT